MEAFRSRQARRSGDPTEDAMTRKFRKTLMATTMLAGLAIFALDAAQAGPNGPSGISASASFSSMRVDLNRIGGPNRLLSRDDARVVPIEIKKSAKGAGKGTKDAAKKDANFARVSNPKSTSGGKGKEDVSNGPALHIPAPLEEIYRVTGGNLDDISQFAEIVGWLKTGLPAAGDVLFPQQGDATFTPPVFGGGGPKGGEPADRNFLDGWPGYSSAPGGPDTSKTGWAGIWTVVEGSQREGDGYRETSYYDRATGRTGTVRTYWGEGGNRREITVQGTDIEEGSDNDWRVDVQHQDGEDGSHTRTVKRTEVVYGNGRNEMAVFTTTTVTVTDAEGNVTETRTEDYPKKEEDSQPVEEGTGRPGRSGWCSPTGGCVTASVIPPRRIIPTEDYFTPQTHSQLPSWATDPCPDCTARGGNGGRSGYSPQDEGGGAPDGPGGTPM